MKAPEPGSDPCEANHNLPQSIDDNDLILNVIVDSKNQSIIFALA